MFEYVSKTTLNGFICFSIFTTVALCNMATEVLKRPFRDKKKREQKNTCDIYMVENDTNKAIFSKMNSINEGFKPLWFAKSGYAQTLLQSMSEFIKLPPDWVSYEYRREIITLDDGVEIALDWKENENMDELTPILLCLHGLGGDSNSSFLRTFTNISVNKGYRVVVYNRRGHGGMSLLPGNKLFPKHVNMDDMDAVVQYIDYLYPMSTKFLIGFSCGANLAVKYLSYISERCSQFSAGVSINNGYDIFRGTKLLADNDKICDGIVTQFLKDILVDGRLNEVKQMCGNLGGNIDFDAVMKAKSLQKLEELLVVPAYEYISLHEYYEDDSCHKVINDVNKPLLCISSRDDPFVHSDVLDIPIGAAKINEKIITIITDNGGHIGWIDSLNNIPWYSRVVFEYLEYFL